MSGLTRAGLSGGGDLYFDMVGAGVGFERLSEMALQIAKRNPDVVIAFGNAAARAARRATSTVPVVMVGVADPVEDGLIRSLGRPGGNLTGLATPYEQLVAKQIELLKEIQPALARVAIFWNPGLEVLEKRRGGIETAVRSLGVELHLVEIGYARDLERAFATTPVARAEALLLPEQAVILSPRDRTLGSTTPPSHCCRRPLVRSGGWLDVVRTRSRRRLRARGFLHGEDSARRQTSRSPGRGTKPV